MADLKREAARQVEKQHSLAREIGAMTHEDFSHQEETKPLSDRSFGLVVATFFVIVSPSKGNLSAVGHSGLQPCSWFCPAVGGSARSAQQMVDEARYSSLSRRQSHCAGALVLCHGDADCAVDANAGQRPVAITPRSGFCELSDR